MHFTRGKKYACPVSPSRNLFIAATLLLATASLHAQNPPPSCPAPPHVQTIRRMQNLPQPVRDALRAKAKDIVDADQPFDATDVVMHGAHFNRFAFAWHTPGRFVIATEHGGIGYNNPVYTVSQQPPRTQGNTVATFPASLVDTVQSRPRDLCSAMADALKKPLPRELPQQPLPASSAKLTR